jgi:hypothetical protein
MVLGVLPVLAVPIFPNPRFSDTKVSRLVAGDFNGDGRRDLVTVEYAGTISVHLGRGDGTFSAGVPIGTGGPQLAVGDFNGDGAQDIVARSPDGTSVLLFKGDYTGGFSSSIPTMDPTHLVLDFAAADLNADGMTDLAVADNTGVRIFLGQTNGTFSVQAPVASAINPPAVALGDFDGDHVLDLAYMWRPFGNSQLDIHMLRGLGNGQFTLMGDNVAANGNGVVSFVSGDLDGDGLDDMALLMQNTQQQFEVRVFFSSGNGTVVPVGPMPARDTWLAAGDLDADGRADLVNSGTSSLRVLTHSGARAFVSADEPAAAVGYVSLADFNGDGKLDVAIARFEETVFLGRGDGTFAIPRIATGGIVQDLAAGDLDGDGKQDLVIADQFNASGNLLPHLTVMRGLGDGRFEAPRYFPAAVDPYGIGLCDIDGDGHLDAATLIKGNSVTLSVYFGAGDGTLLPSVSIPLQGVDGYRIVCGDLDHDGRGDLMVGNSGGNVAVILGRSDRSVGPPVFYTMGTGALGIALADVNEDGQLDLLATGPSGATERLGIGDGSFAPAVTLSSSGGWGVAAADFDRDGHLDLALTGVTAPGSLDVLFGRGDGTFLAPQQMDSAAGAQTILAADLDFDGWPDIVLNGNPNTNDPFLAFYRNTHHASFEPPVRFADGWGGFVGALADFNGDTALDLAAAGGQSGAIVLLNGSAVDTDGDGVFDGADCAPTDAGAFAVPVEVSGVAFAGNALSWNSEATVAGTGTVYDVARGSVPGFGSPAVCLGDALSATTIDDASIPPADAAFWYDVRAKNVCGSGGYGSASNGTPRSISACP